MATEFARINSNNYPEAMHYIGQYDRIESYPRDNKTKIRLYAILNDSNPDWSGGYGSDWSTFKIDGTTVKTGSYRQYYGSTTLGTKDILVTHNPDGTFPSTGISLYADSFHFNSRSTTGYISGLPSIDRSAATQTVTITNLGATSFTVTVVASETCEKFEYSFDSGSTWTTFSTTEGTSASVTITGLTPASTYALTTRVTRSYNGIAGTATTSVSTLGFSVFDSVPNIDVANTITVTYHAFVTEYYCKIRFLQGTTVLATETIGLVDSLTTQTYTSTYVFPASLLPNATSGSITAELITYSSSAYTTEIGRDIATFTLTVPDTATYNPSATYTLTPYSTNTWINTNALYVAGFSAIDVAVTPSAGSGASVTSVVLENVNYTTTGTYTYRTEVITYSGNKTFRIVVTDSRGRSVTISVTQAFLYYSAPSITTFQSQRGTYESGTWTNNESAGDIRITLTGSRSLSQQGNALTVVVTCDISGTDTPPTASSGNYYYWHGTSPDLSYMFTATITDSVGTVAMATLMVSSVSVPFNLNVNLPSAAFGKVAEIVESLEIASDWTLTIGGVTIPDPDEAGKVLAMKADGTGLEWISLST